jgi:SAM-dependent methyltransferase
MHKIRWQPTDRNSKEQMSNPWLEIPLDDYEGHMSLPAVGQAQMIAEQLDRSLDRWAPTSIAVIGCAGGNGLDRIAGGTVERVVAVDVNPDYIERTRDRHAQRLQGLELVCADVQSESLIYDPVDFTYAALLFEYVGLLSTLKTLKRNSRPDAVLTVVLQLPHSSVPAISPSPYKSLGNLATAMTLVAPERLCQGAEHVGFTVTDSTILDLPSGKRFCVQNFRV